MLRGSAGFSTRTVTRVRPSAIVIGIGDHSFSASPAAGAILGLVAAGLVAAFCPPCLAGVLENFAASRGLRSQRSGTRTFLPSLFWYTVTKDMGVASWIWA